MENISDVNRNGRTPPPGRKAVQNLILVVFGLLCSLLLLEAGLTAAGAARALGKRLNRPGGVPGKHAYVIMCIGESTTDDQYPHALRKEFGQRFGEGRVIVYDEGKGGTNTSVLLSTLDAKLDRDRPDMVVAMMGINDRGGVVPWIPVKRERSFLSSLRTYRLYLLLKMHLEARFLEPRLPEARVPSPDDPQPPTQDEIAANEAIERYLDLQRHTRVSMADVERIFGDRLRRQPDNGYLLREYAQALCYEHAFGAAERQLVRALRLLPGDRRASLLLASVYDENGRFEEGAALLERWRGAHPRDIEAQELLVRLYRKWGKREKARAVFGELLAADPEYCNGTLALSIGETDIAARHFALAARRQRARHNPDTFRNYRAIVDKVTSRGIAMVAMQYPLRSVEPLKDMLYDHPEVIFVDNEQPFRDVLRTEPYESCFTDEFAGDFGHCTDRGNALIARTLADTVEDVIRRSRR